MGEKAGLWGERGKVTREGVRCHRGTLDREQTWRTGASGSDSAQPSLLAAQPRLGFFLLMMAATSLSGGKRQT